MALDREKVRIKYNKVIVIHTSKVRKVAAMTSMPWKVSSWMETTDTMAESLMVEINWPARKTPPAGRPGEGSPAKRFFSGKVPGKKQPPIVPGAGC